jgi:uncharacterized protein (TIGR02246 family)
MNSLRHFTWISFSLALAVALPAAGQEPSPDEKAIEDAAIKFVDAYNAKDAAAVTALFDSQARFETADGTVLVGEEAIRDAFTEAFESDPNGQISLDMESLTLLTPDVAVEQGSTGFFPDGETLTSSGKYLVVHLKKNGAWKMISARSMEPEVLSHYEYLRRLEWLLGDWIDEGEDETVNTTFRWDEKRNFLLQEFEVLRGSEVLIKGSQRIGWDPQAKQIRGWIFDSEGGFGESRWVENDGAWVITSSGVSNTAENATSTRTLTPNGDRVEVQITGRLSAGETLPDLAFTMVRRPPLPATQAAAPASN